PCTLLEVLNAAPGDRTAIIVPEADIRVSYAALRAQVMTTADALASAGIKRGDRVAMALPNGLPAIVSFLAASVAGTAAPLNPAYRQEEFAFYMEDTGAKVLILPTEGGEAARLAAGDNIPVFTADMGADGNVVLSTFSQPGAASPPGPDD